MRPCTDSKRIGTMQGSPIIYGEVPFLNPALRLRAASGSISDLAKLLSLARPVFSSWRHRLPEQLRLRLNRLPLRARVRSRQPPAFP